MATATITRSVFFSQLEEKMREHEMHPNAPRENDLDHIHRLIRRAPEIKTECSLDFDMDEFRALALLHEIDRSYSLDEPLKALGAKMLSAMDSSEGNSDPKNLKRLGIKGYVENELESSGFSRTEISRITLGVLDHNKRDDDLIHDSPLLTAFRIADKLDRMGPYGVLTAIIHRCPAMPLFDPIAPFGYTSTVEGRLASAYNDWMRVFEWYAMLPFDEARMMIRHEFEQRVFFVRQIAAEYATNRGIENGVEGDLKNALGQYYTQFANSK